jgi:hypothetical protein
MIFTFIIWKQNPSLEQRILEDLQNRYEIRAIFHTEWSDKTWARSLARLYNRPVQHEPRNWKKLSEVGYKPFIFVVISDPAPQMAVYNDKGILRYGNVNIFKSKQDYRDWAGTSFAVHSSIDDAETCWNLALILGRDYERIIEERASDVPTNILPRRIDAWGASGWESHADMFSLLGLTAKYAIIRHSGAFPVPRSTPEGPDINVLVQDVGRAANALNPILVNVKKACTTCYVSLAGGWNKIDLYDQEQFSGGKKWASDILENATKDSNGHWFADPSDDSYLFLFNGLTKPEKMLGGHYRAAVSKLYGETKPDGLPPSGDAEFLLWCRTYFDKFSRAKGYDISPSTYGPQKEKRKRREVSISGELLKTIIATPPIYSARRTNFHSAVWKHDLSNTGPIAVKLVETHDPILAKVITREHIFLERLRGPLVPDVIWGGMIGKRYCLISRWVGGIPINRMEPCTLARIISQNGLDWFENQLHGICDHLEKNGISHRDLGANNIMLSRDRVYLIDFTWGIFIDEDNPPVKSKFQNSDDRRDAATLVNDVKRRVGLLG